MNRTVESAAKSLSARHPLAYTVVHIGRPRGTQHAAPLRHESETPFRTSYVIIGLLVMFILAAVVSRHSIERVYKTLAAVVDDEDGVVPVEADVAKPPPLISGVVDNGTPDTETTNRRQEVEFASDERERVPATPAPKHYSHGMLQRVVEGVMKHVHRRKHHSRRWGR
jgi:hypothetical protein